MSYRSDEGLIHVSHVTKEQTVHRNTHTPIEYMYTQFVFDVDG